MENILKINGVVYSSVLNEEKPLRLKSQINKIPKLQGVFAMKDQEGFPIDMSYEMARDRGWEIDWIEAMVDASRQCIFKYDTLVDEIRMLEPNKINDLQRFFAAFMMADEGETFEEKAENLYKKMHISLIYD